MKYLSIVGFQLLAFISLNLQANDERWNTKNKIIEIKIKGKQWTKLTENYSQLSSAYVVFQKKTGSSIFVVVESDKNLKNSTLKDLDSTLINALKKKSPKTRVLTKTFQVLGSKKFRVITYSYKNPKFGWQRLKQLYLKIDEVLIIMSLSWPEELKYNESKLAPNYILDIVDTVRLVKT